MLIHKRIRLRKRVAPALVLPTPQGRPATGPQSSSFSALPRPAGLGPLSLSFSGLRVKN